MGRKRSSTLDDIATLPWPVGIAIGVAGYFVIRHVIPGWLAHQQSPLLQGLAGLAPMFASIAWLVLFAFTMAAAKSFFDSRHRRRLLDAQTGFDSIAAMGWRDFERLVGEAFRRRGYTVEETGLGGADGGIDLILRRNGQRTLVQCKQWRRQKVPVNVVREMFGLLAHHNADAVQIAASGGFTPDAARFAQGKPIELIDGATLLGMIREVQADRGAGVLQTSATTGASAEIVEAAGREKPNCSRCGGAMVERINRKTGSKFFGCAAYPRRLGTL